MSLSRTAPSEARERIRPFAWLRQIMPRALLARALIIVIAPIVILQLVVSYLFFDRHFETVTHRLSRSAAGSIALIIGAYENFGGEVAAARLNELSSTSLGIEVAIQQDARLPATRPQVDTITDRILRQELGAIIRQPLWFDANSLPQHVDIRVQLGENVLRVLIERKRVIATNTHIFFAWMIASALVLTSVAVLFLLNQVRPIQRLAVVAERFGRGQDVPDFKPSGATEVRSAALAFLDMRQRIVRFLQQRTDMLSGVSHDLRTPLTRMKLQVAFLPENADTAALKSDIAEMERMLDEYLAFARGEGTEAAAAFDFADLLDEIAGDARRKHPEAQIEISAPARLDVFGRRNALKRCVGNLADNAMRHGRTVKITALRSQNQIEVAVDDDGPGIPAALHEEAFRPFRRLEESRNPALGGVGLGLAIARDIARSHGGDIALSTSPLGGLRASLRLPA